jgi:hypothetical protein
VAELVGAADVLELAAADATEVLELELLPLLPQPEINTPLSTAIAPSAHSLLIMVPPSECERGRSVPTAPSRGGAIPPPARLLHTVPSDRPLASIGLGSI